MKQPLKYGQAEIGCLLCGGSMVVLEHEVKELLQKKCVRCKTGDGLHAIAMLFNDSTEQEKAGER